MEYYPVSSVKGGAHTVFGTLILNIVNLYSKILNFVFATKLIYLYLLFWQLFKIYAIYSTIVFKIAVIYLILCYGHNLGLGINICCCTQMGISI